MWKSDLYNLQHGGQNLSKICADSGFSLIPGNYYRVKTAIANPVWCESVVHLYINAPKIGIQSFYKSSTSTYDNVYITNPVILRDENKTAERYIITVKKSGSSAVSRVVTRPSYYSGTPNIITFWDACDLTGVAYSLDVSYTVTVGVDDSAAGGIIQHNGTVSSSRSIVLRAPVIAARINGAAGPQVSVSATGPIRLADINRCMDGYRVTIQEYTSTGTGIGTQEAFIIFLNGQPDYDLYNHCSIRFPLSSGRYYKVTLGASNGSYTQSIMMKT